MKSRLIPTGENLRTKMLHHLAGIVLVLLIFVVLGIYIDSLRDKGRLGGEGIQQYIDLHAVDFGNPVDRALFRESLEIFFPGRTAQNDSVLRAIDDFRQRSFTDPMYKQGGARQGLSWQKVSKLIPMYAQFVGVYLFVLAVIYTLAQRIALYRFVKMKQRKESYLEEFLAQLKDIGLGKGKNIFEWIREGGMLVVKALIKGISLAVFFSPAYVIAYSLKTSVDTSSLLFMAVLAVVSNGVLVHTSNRLFSILVSESRKGYVQTAVVKNLLSSYAWDTPDGIAKSELLRLRGGFRGHVLSHIFENAHFQFVPTLKEHASFLVTGLIIIEMALNIQGHLCYELLQLILYREFEAALVIVFGIFVLVKATEIAVDVWTEREKQRYGYDSPN